MTNAESRRFLHLALAQILQGEGVFHEEVLTRNRPDDERDWTHGEVRERASPPSISSLGRDHLVKSRRWPFVVHEEMREYVGVTFDQMETLCPRRKRYHERELAELQGELLRHAVNERERWTKATQDDEVGKNLQEEFHHALYNTGQIDSNAERDALPAVWLPRYTAGANELLLSVVEQAGRHVAHLEALDKVQHYLDGHDTFVGPLPQRIMKPSDAARAVMEALPARSRKERVKLARSYFVIERYRNDERAFTKALDKAFTRLEKEFGITKEGTPVAENTPDLSSRITDK